MAGTADLTKLVPGFEFLQNWMKTAGGGAVPDMTQWMAPTLDADELAKRIEQLRTVQFWLEQNARMMTATIQALEVQRMTLATLQTMNVPLAGLREAMTLPTAPTARSTGPAGAAAAPTAPAADPLQWWNALTTQFGTLAAQAMKDAAATAAGAPGAPGASAAPPVTPAGAADPADAARKRPAR